MSERRHRKLVDNFQFKLIARMAIYWAVYQFTLWNVLFCWKLLKYGKGDLLEQYVQFSKEFAPMLLCFLILVPAIIWDAVKFYHRIAGPLVRIKRALRDVAEQRPLGYVRLRDNDELMELQDQFNGMLNTLSRAGAVTIIGANPSNTADAQMDPPDADCSKTDNEQYSHV